jgi:hypothetical protein
MHLCNQPSRLHVTDDLLFRLGLSHEIGIGTKRNDEPMARALGIPHLHRAWKGPYIARGARSLLRHREKSRTLSDQRWRSETPAKCGESQDKPMRSLPLLLIINLRLVTLALRLGLVIGPVVSALVDQHIVAHAPIVPGEAGGRTTVRESRARMGKSESR